MKKSALFVCLLLASVPASAAEIPASSSITSVTVYPDRALVTREAKVELEAGANQIAFDGLPSALLEESLRADGKAAFEVSMKGVEIKRVFAAGEADPRVEALTKEVRALENEVRALQNDQQALQQQRAFLDSFRNFEAAQIPKDVVTKNPAPADWAAYSQFVLDGYKDNAAKTLAVEQSIFSKNQELSAKQQELYALQGGYGQEKKTALVSVDAKAKGSFSVSLTYIVPQASWSVSYDANVYPDKKEARLTSYGNVRQWTGEDWKDVSLTLSTAKPAVGGRMPELAPWYVDFYAPAAPMPMAYAERRAKSGLLAKEAAYDGFAGAAAPAAMAVEEQQANLAVADVSQELGSVNYDIAGKGTVLSDNRAYKFPAHQETFKAELDYESTPKLSPYAYIHSKVVNDKDFTLPGGSLNVFVDDDYVGTSSIGTVGRGEAFDLYLGVDEDVKIKRTELVDKKKKSLLGLRARKDYGYKMEMENYRKDPIKLTIVDQLPVSKNADIKSELVSSSVKPAETKDLNIYKWTFELQPREKKSFEFQFFVEYPSDKTVTGV